MAAEEKQDTVPLSFRELLLSMQPSVPLTALAVLLVVAQFDARLSLFLAHTIAAVGCFLVMNVVSSSYARGGNGYLRYIAYAIPWAGMFELSIAFRAAHGDMPGIAEDLHRAVFLMHAGLLAVAPLWIGRKVRLAAAVVPWGVVSLFTGMITAIAGINIFSLGVTFNYLVSLFYKKPIRQGLFGKPIFKTPLDQQFGWMGIASMVLGLVIGLVSLVLGLQGWEIERFWFYLLGSALVFLIGLQLVIYWLLLRVLEELSRREILTRQDMGLV